MKKKQKLIDAYKLLDSETFQVNAETSCGVCERDYRNAVLSAPAVDAVEVVRCRDCSWRDSEEYALGKIWCNEWNCVRPHDFFCVDGERCTD